VLDALLRMSRIRRRRNIARAERTRGNSMVGWARRILLLIVAGCVGVTLWHLGRGFRSSEVELDWPLLVLATSCLVVTNLMQAMAWVRLLNRMTHRLLRSRRFYRASWRAAGPLHPSGKVALLWSVPLR